MHILMSFSAVCNPKSSKEYQRIYCAISSIALEASQMPLGPYLSVLWVAVGDDVLVAVMTLKPGDNSV